MANRYNVGFDAEKMVADMDPGVERAVLRKLSFHVGRDNAISRPDLVKAIHMHGYHIDERIARYAVNALRKQGVPICSTGGIGGGYWMAADWRELEEFLDREYRARIKDLSEQVQALVKHAKERWGPQQSTLF